MNRLFTLANARLQAQNQLAVAQGNIALNLVNVYRALGGGWSDFSLSDGLGDGSANTFNAGIYGRQGFGKAYVTGAFAYGFHDVETSRAT